MLVVLTCQVAVVPGCLEGLMLLMENQHFCIVLSWHSICKRCHLEAAQWVACMSVTESSACLHLRGCMSEVDKLCICVMLFCLCANCCWLMQTRANYPILNVAKGPINAGSSLLLESAEAQIGCNHTVICSSL